MSVNGVEWSPDVVCVFDGVQHVLDLCLQWYEEHLTAHVAENSLREHLKDDNDTSTSETAAQPNSPAPAVGLPSGIRIFEAEPILDRKSAFVGRACAITDPAEVNSFSEQAVIVSYPFEIGSYHPLSPHIRQTNSASRAPHNKCLAMSSRRGTTSRFVSLLPLGRCAFPQIFSPDNDDDGETAAGGRLAHLLQILVRNPFLGLFEANVIH